jgi:hypothetical protein
LIPSITLAQNVGIGITNPTKGKLEVFGASGSTAASFGTDGTGISLQRNWPTIGFNEYTDANNIPRYMGTGKASVLYFEPFGGNFGLDMYSTTGNAGLQLSGTPTRALTILNNGNVGIRSTGLNDATLWVTKNNNFSGSAILGGTVYSSHFAYSNFEDTYIRGGLDNSKLILNDVPNGKTGIGDAATNTALITSTLSVFGSLKLPYIYVTDPLYYVTENDYVMLVDLQNNNSKLINIILPPANAGNDGRIYQIKGINLPNIGFIGSPGSGFIKITGLEPDFFSSNLFYRVTNDFILGKTREERSDAITVQSIHGKWYGINHSYYQWD